MNKIKTIIFVLALVGISNFAFAQAQVALGIKGGVNFANVDAKSTVSENYNNRTGFHGGAFALFKFTAFGIQPEVIFSQQGSTVKVNSQDLEANFSYINVPIMLKFYLPLGINLQAGPQFGFLSKAEAQQVIGNSIQTVDVKSAQNNSDFGVGLGAGWDLPFGVTIDARYNLGLSKVNDTNDAKNQVFQLSLGYKLIKFGK